MTEFNGFPLITIVTVNLNGLNFLEETILSVINQSYKNIEYLVIDGGSTDGSIDIIKKYEDKIDYWESCKDRGIYDAMNKGIDLSCGNWINFLNSGDTFVNNNVLEKIFFKNEHNNAFIMYGDVEVRYPSGRKRINKSGKISSLSKGSQFSHQAAFIRSEYHKNNKYSIEKKIVADFDFFYSARNNNINFKYMDMTISSVSSGGLSDVQRIESIVGWWNVVEKSDYLNLYFVIKILHEMLKKKLKSILRF
jgi:glycosyltransferase involved in cell wall biosynthesis